MKDTVLFMSEFSSAPVLACFVAIHTYVLKMTHFVLDRDRGL